VRRRAVAFVARRLRADPVALLFEGTASIRIDSDGSAVVIHAAPDDFRTDPTGNSGARIACGVIMKK